MADLKISQLPVATTPLAGTELVPIVQSATTKQTTAQAILTGTVPSGTANGVTYLNGSKVVTSGSALTFDGTTLSAPRFQIQSGGFIVDGGGNVTFNPSAGGSLSIVSNSAFTNGNIVYNALAASGLHVFQINNSEQMRLNSTGLGIGTIPTVNLDVFSSTAAATARVRSTNSNAYLGISRADGSSEALLRIQQGATNSWDIGFQAGQTALQFINLGSERMRLDASGNLGLGVTPSASWFASSKAIQIGTSSAPYMSLVQQTSATADGYMLWGARLTGDRAFQYTTTGDAACAYRQNSGQHTWFNAASGTAGNAITFTQAMTLDANGRLMVGTTSPSGILTVVQNSNSATIFAISNSDTGSSASARIAFDTAGGGNYIETRRNGGGLWFNVNASDRLNIDNGGNVLNVGSGGLGYGTGSGGAITQATSRTTGVTLNKTNGAITLVSAAGTTAWQSFTVTNSTVAATDTVIVSQKSGTDLYQIFVTAVAAGSFRISFATTGGTTTEQPVFNFAVIKAVTA